MHRILTLLLVALASALSSVASASDPPRTATPVNGRWMGSDGKTLPFETHEQLVAFLQTAKVVSRKELQGGVNRPLKLRLEQEGVEANAIFRLVDIKHRRAKLDGKLIADFHDSHIYECAAYEVSRLLGIDNVPPCVRRRIELTNGTVQLWIENAMTEKERRSAGQDPPRLRYWQRQKQTMRLFDALIYNFDRNQGNMLIDSSWKLWFIDHTRSFRKSAVIEKPEKIVWCERGVWEKLKTLDKKQLTKSLRPYVDPMQINMMLKRRDKLIDRIQARIEKSGVGTVLYDASDTGEDSFSSTELADLGIDEDIPETSSMLEETID